jgi:predicted nucleotidyltransferase
MKENMPYIDQIISIIVSHVAPDQIILFGSYARGGYTDKSDIDLLIIKKDMKNGHTISDELYMAFFENKIRIPVDVIPIDYDKYNQLNNQIGYIYKTIKKEGKIIYGAA